MPRNDPKSDLDPRYSEEGAAPTPWVEGRERLERAELYMLSTVRADGRLHATPLIAVWSEDALYFCTGPDEQKAKNLAHDQHCLLTTGSNRLEDDLNLVVEADAVRVRDDGLLRRVAGAYESKYGSEWHFDVADGAFHHEAGEAWVFEVAPRTAYGFGNGGHTRWRF